jgi:hypothetical protein
MPNGDPHWHETEKPMLEAYFARIVNVLTEFAAKRNLEIARYYHQAPEWSFCYAHPRGGTGKVIVEKLEEAKVRVGGLWWIDDCEKFTRSIKRSKQEDCAFSTTELTACLEKMLRQVLSWELGTWTEVATGYESTWGRYPKEELKKILAVNYPLPNTD